MIMIIINVSSISIIHCVFEDKDDSYISFIKTAVKNTTTIVIHGHIVIISIKRITVLTQKILMIGNTTNIYDNNKK